MPSRRAASEMLPPASEERRLMAPNSARASDGALYSSEVQVCRRRERLGGPSGVEEPHRDVVGVRRLWKCVRRAETASIRRRDCCRSRCEHELLGAGGSISCSDLTARGRSCPAFEIEHGRTRATSMAPRRAAVVIERRFRTCSGIDDAFARAVAVSLVVIDDRIDGFVLDV